MNSEKKILKEIMQTYKKYGSGSAELQKVLMKYTTSEKRFDVSIR